MITLRPILPKTNLEYHLKWKITNSLSDATDQLIIRLAMNICGCYDQSISNLSIFAVHLKILWQESQYVK